MHPINQELIDRDLLCGEVDVPEIDGYYVPDPSGGSWSISEPDEFFEALRWMIQAGKSRVVLRGPINKCGQCVMYDDGAVVYE